MELSYRCFFRLGICLLLLFVAFRNFKGFPMESEAVIRAGGIRGYSSSGSYRSMYPGRVIYNSFGRSSSSRRRGSVPMDAAERNRLYYEKKVAEWREKNKHLLPEEMDEETLQDDEEPSEESSEYDYDYDTTTDTVEETNATTTEATAPVVNASISSTPATMEEEQALNGASTENSTTTFTEAGEETTTPVTVLTLTGSKSTVAPRRAYGLRYGRVRVERLQ